MKKKIIAEKLLIGFDEKGNFDKAMLIYRIEYESGKITPLRTISVKAALNAVILNPIFKEAVRFAEKQEGVSND